MKEETHDKLKESRLKIGVFKHETLLTWLKIPGCLFNLFEKLILNYIYTFTINSNTNFILLKEGNEDKEKDV